MSPRQRKQVIDTAQGGNLTGNLFSLARNNQTEVAAFFTAERQKGIES
jgi:hypothetical protein